jgi:stage IV sporulation protein FB
MTWSFPIGRLFGSQLRVHVTFLLLIAFIGASSWAERGPEAALWTTLFILLLFACVVAHEFGHALMARRFGILTPDITLLPIGGLARLEKMPEKPGQEILVALAGPAVNVVIWAVLSLLFGAPTETDQLAGLSVTPSTLPAQLATLNLVLAVFNMIPAFPMDGGRVLRAVVALFTDRVTATRIAAGAGQVVAFLMALAGLMSGNLMLVLVAGFIFIAAGGESADVAMRDVARRLMARDAMITEYESLRPEDAIGLAATTLIRTTQHEFPVLDAGGHLAGFLTREALFHAMAGDRANIRVGEVMQTVPSVRLTDGLETVLERLGANPAVAVLDREGHLLGYITRENVGELMVIANARR